ncbi:MAG: cation-translocating P-type ATPase [Chloroflexi bacterium]|nr:cation-translocating P-type ATPase [Chloroflexota bacterium]
MTEQKISEQSFVVTGMDCADCARSIEKGVGKLSGVQTCSINFTAGKLHVAGDVPRAIIVARVNELGYGVQADVENTKLAAQAPLPRAGLPGFIQFLLQRRDTTLALIGLIFILPGLLFHELLPVLGANNPLWNLTSMIALAVAGYPVVRSALRTLRINHEISINLLMTIAAIGAILIGAYTEAGLVMVLFAIGEALEGYTMQRTRDSIRSMVEIAPNEATVLRPCLDCQAHLGKEGYTGGPCPFCGIEEQRIAVTDLVVGDTIVVKPGERIAMDGRVLKGMSAVNQAPITGESIPVEKQPDAPIFAGSINGEGVLEIEVTKLAADNTVSRMIKMVEAAQERRAPVQRFVDQFAQYYTPAVVAIALLVALIPPLFFHAPFWNPDATTQGWLYRALALLVVACPCALVISTPVSLVSAIGNAARNGILFKGGMVLEALSKIKVFAFDKTGTLTAGNPSVIKVRSVNCLPEDLGCKNCDDLLALTSAVERRSEHPLARAVVRAADRRGVQGNYPAAQDVTALMGKGVSGQVNGRDILIGSHAYFDSNVPHQNNQCVEIDAASAQGYTSMLVSADQQYLGYITVADQVRESSQTALKALKAAGIETLVMLTGDNRATAQTIADAVGVTDIRADLLPENKVTAVNELLQQYQAVAMVGDGVNDAPALATATVGIAMGAGTAQALETADITLMGDDLRQLPFALQLSRAAMKVIRQNIAFAIGIKLIFLVIVLLGFGSLWMAVLADVGASLLVTLHGMRLLHWRGAQ